MTFIFEGIVVAVTEILRLKSGHLFVINLRNEEMQCSTSIFVQNSCHFSWKTILLIGKEYVFTELIPGTLSKKGTSPRTSVLSTTSKSLCIKKEEWEKNHQLDVREILKELKQLSLTTSDEAYVQNKESLRLISYEGLISNIPNPGLGIYCLDNKILLYTCFMKGLSVLPSLNTGDKIQCKTKKLILCGLSSIRIFQKIEEEKPSGEASILALSCLDLAQEFGLNVNSFDFLVDVAEILENKLSPAVISREELFKSQLGNKNRAKNFLFTLASCPCFLNGHPLFKLTQRRVLEEVTSRPHSCFPAYKETCFQNVSFPTILETFKILEEQGSVYKKLKEWECTCVPFSSSDTSKPLLLIGLLDSSENGTIYLKDSTDSISLCIEKDCPCQCYIHGCCLPHGLMKRSIIPLGFIVAIKDGRLVKEEIKAMSVTSESREVSCYLICKLSSVLPLVEVQKIRLKEIPYCKEKFDCNVYDNIKSTVTCKEREQKNIEHTNSVSLSSNEQEQIKHKISAQKQMFTSKSGVSEMLEKEFTSKSEICGMSDEYQMFTFESVASEMSEEEQVFTCRSGVCEISGQDQMFSSSSGVIGISDKEQVFKSKSEVSGMTAKEQVFISRSGVKDGLSDVCEMLLKNESINKSNFFLYIAQNLYVHHTTIPFQKRVGHWTFQCSVTMVGAPLIVLCNKPATSKFFSVTKFAETKLEGTTEFSNSMKIQEFPSAVTVLCKDNSSIKNHLRKAVLDFYDVSVQVYPLIRKGNYFKLYIPVEDILTNNFLMGQRYPTNSAHFKSALQSFVFSTQVNIYGKVEVEDLEEEKDDEALKLLNNSSLKCAINETCKINDVKEILSARCSQKQSYSVQGRIVGKWLQPGKCSGCFDNVNIGFMLEDCSSKHRVFVYLSDIPYHSFPLGLVPGAIVQISGLRRLSSQKGNIYLKATSMLGIEVVKVDWEINIDFYRKDFGQNRESNITTRETVTPWNFFCKVASDQIQFRTLCHILCVLHVEIFPVCTYCSKSWPCEQHSENGCRVEAKARALVDDGSGQAILHCADKNVQSLLDLTEQEFEVFTEYVRTSEIRLDYDMTDKTEITNIVEQGFQFLCGNDITTRQVVLECCSYIRPPRARWTQQIARCGFATRKQTNKQSRSFSTSVGGSAYSAKELRFNNHGKQSTFSPLCSYLFNNK
ncbi:uncharacterized protein LOC143231940 isoform X3 [Tachypleus tridentatus]|uniref:uncharacterized protein LOC143231940 isoform X3 n=1 Tax=Tachypleus tridentatus TaxID=6853 RepID=UPI003FD5FE76